MSVKLVGHGFDKSVLLGLRARVRVETAAVPSGEIVIASEAPSGQKVRASVGQPSMTMSAHELVALGMLQEVGCHKVTAEVDGMRSDTLLINVEAPSYINGFLQVSAPAVHSFSLATAIHRGTASQQVITWLDPRGPMTGSAYPVALEIPANAHFVQMPSGTPSPIQQVTWELLWAQDQSIVVASFNPLIEAASVQTPGMVTAILGAYRDDKMHVAALALCELSGAQQVLSLIGFAGHHEAAPQGQLRWTAPLPGDLGRMITGIASLDMQQLALVGRSNGGVVIAHATFSAQAPPATFATSVHERAVILDDAPPALGSSTEGPLVGALLQLPEGEKGQEETWHRLVWNPKTDDRRLSTAGVKEIIAARLMFRTNPDDAGPGDAGLADDLVLITRSPDHRIQLSTTSKRRDGGSLGAHEPLRAAANAFAIKLLRVDPEQGARAVDITP